MQVRGSYSFIDPEGERFSLQYLADKRGFQPTADHLPVVREETAWGLWDWKGCEEESMVALSDVMLVL